MYVLRTGCVALFVTLGLSLPGCGGSSGGGNNNGGEGDNAPNVPATYSFDSAFNSGESSVAYSGQIARQLLIAELNHEIGTGLQEKIGAGVINASSSLQDILDILESYYDGGTSTLADEPLRTVPANSLQKTFGDISLDKNLVGKTAGNDSATDHRDWKNGGFSGWQADSPEALVRAWFDEISRNAMMVAAGQARAVDFSASNSGVHSLRIYQTTDGLDLKQLVQKFLLGAIAFSQGTDDYFDDATPDKGLLTDNIVPNKTGAAYTTLEHQFDEGYGYFGAARNYNDYSDDEIAGKGGRAEFSSGYNDANGDGLIDLNSEFNFGNSTNAAKRDLGSSTGTDLSADAFNALLNGRAIVSAAVGRELTDAELTALKAQRDLMVAAWEKAVAATVVHYINDVMADMDKMGAEDYSYADHIKHWGELKGFALGLQFNPRSPLLADSDASGVEDFVQFHGLVGERPALPDAGASELNDYRADLLAARALMAQAYGFASQDVENW